MKATQENSQLDKKRFEAFIDAIFAIVITFLVLEFKVPHLEDATGEILRESLLEMLPLFLCYILSFFTIVSVWIDHHYLFKAIKYVNKPFALINFLFILSASALPFTTGFAGEYIDSPLAVAFFCTSILVMNVIFSIVFVYPMRKQLIDYEKMPNVKNASAIATVGLVFEAASIPLAFVNIPLAMGLVCLVIPLHLFKRM